MNVGNLGFSMLFIALAAGMWAMLWRTMFRRAIITKLHQKIMRRRIELLADIETADRPHLLTLARYENLHSSIGSIDLAAIVRVSHWLKQRPDIVAKIDAERDEIRAAGIRFEKDLRDQHIIVSFAIMANSPFYSATLVVIVLGAFIFDSCKERIERMVIAEEAIDGASAYA